MMNKIITANLALLASSLMLVQAQAAEPVYPDQVKWFGLGRGSVPAAIAPLPVMKP